MIAKSYVNFVTFPLATSPFESLIQFVIVAYLSRGPGTTGDIAAGCAIDQHYAWVQCRALSAAGMIIQTVRRRYVVTPEGIQNLLRFHADLSMVIQPFQNITK